MNSTNEERNTKRNEPTDCAERSSFTEKPRWHASTSSGVTPTTQGSSRKLYVLLTLWAVVLTVAMAAAVSDNTDTAGQQKRQTPAAFLHHEGKEASEEPDAAETDHVKLNIDLEQLDTRFPAAFRNTRANSLIHAEWLAPVAHILSEGKRPLRVLHIGDSHVAGKSFPQALKSTLTAALGEAPSADEGEGVWFSYVGSNGATSQRFLSEAYMSRFAEARPDFIILSLGTNEAHGMGYREDLHDRQLNEFFRKLREACPDATVMLTTPPGDYLTTSYVNYRRTSRHSRKKVKVVRRASRVNPMSSRCAANIVNYGEEHHMAAWDLFNICGGEEGPAQRNWVSAHLMRADRIHFEPAGYKLQGQMLGEAILRGLHGCE